MSVDDDLAPLALIDRKFIGSSTVLPPGCQQLDLHVADHHLGAVDPGIHHRAGLHPVRRRRRPCRAGPGPPRRGRTPAPSAAARSWAGCRRTCSPGCRRGAARRRRAHAGEHRVAHGGPRRAEPRRQGGVAPRRAAPAAGPDRAVLREERLGRGDRGKALHVSSPGAVGHQRVALALVLAVQVVDQPGEEQPERVERELGDVDVAGDGADLCMVALSVLVRMGKAARPRRGGPAGRSRPGWRTAARSRWRRRST